MKRLGRSVEGTEGDVVEVLLLLGRSRSHLLLLLRSHDEEEEGKRSSAQMEAESNLRKRRLGQR